MQLPKEQNKDRRNSIVQSTIILIEQGEPHKTRSWTQVLQKGYQFQFHL